MELHKIIILATFVFLLYRIFFYNNQENFSDSKKPKDCCAELEYQKSKNKGVEKYQKELSGEINKINNQNEVKVNLLEKKISNYENKIKKIETKMKNTTSKLLLEQKKLLEKAHYTAETIKQIKEAGKKMQENTDTDKLQKNNNIKNLPK